MQKRQIELIRVVVFGLVLILHVLLVLRNYPTAVFRSGDIPVKGDVSRYFATAYGAANVSGIYGYDPHFMAGYPVGLWNSMGKKGFEILSMLFPWVGLSRLFYATIVSLCILSPLLIWSSLRRRCESRRSSMILFALCLLTWHLATQVAYFWQFGNIFFPAAACLLVPFLLFVDRMLRGHRAVLSACCAALCGAAIFYCHTVVLLSAVVPILVLFALHRRRLCRMPQAWLPLAVLAVVWLAVVGWWLFPLLAYRDHCLSQPKPWFIGGPKHLVMDLFCDRAYGHQFDRNAILQTLVVAGLAGTWLVRRKDALTMALGIGGVGALLLAYGFTYLGRLSSIQPYRFLIPAMILFLRPAAVAMERGLVVFGKLNKAGKILVMLLLFVLLPRFGGYLIDLKWPPLPCGVSSSQRATLEAVRDLPVKGRLLCDEVVAGHLIPSQCGVPVIGGLSAQAFLGHRFAGIDEDGILFGRNASQWKPENLLPYLKLYAVDYALFSRADWLSFAHGPGSPFVPAGRAGEFEVFKVGEAAPSLVYSGAAEARADYDRIEVTGVAGTNLILKLHFAGWLAADRGVHIRPVSLLDDPVPFIGCRVPAGVDSFTIAKKGCIE